MSEIVMIPFAQCSHIRCTVILKQSTDRHVNHTFADFDLWTPDLSTVFQKPWTFKRWLYTEKTSDGTFWGGPCPRVMPGWGLCPCAPLQFVPMVPSSHYGYGALSLGLIRFHLVFLPQICLWLVKIYWIKYDWAKSNFPSNSNTYQSLVDFSTCTYQTSPCTFLDSDRVVHYVHQNFVCTVLQWFVKSNSNIPFH